MALRPGGHVLPVGAGSAQPTGRPRRQEHHNDAALRFIRAWGEWRTRRGSLIEHGSTATGQFIQQLFRVYNAGLASQNSNNSVADLQCSSTPVSPPGRRNFNHLHDALCNQRFYANDLICNPTTLSLSLPSFPPPIMLLSFSLSRWRSLAANKFLDGLSSSHS